MIGIIDMGFAIVNNPPTDWTDGMLNEKITSGHGNTHKENVK